jgi:hypothetical protein
MGGAIALPSALRPDVVVVRQHSSDGGAPEVRVPEIPVLVSDRENARPRRALARTPSACRSGGPGAAAVEIVGELPVLRQGVADRRPCRPPTNTCVSVPCRCSEKLSEYARSSSRKMLRPETFAKQPLRLVEDQARAGTAVRQVSEKQICRVLKRNCVRCSVQHEKVTLDARESFGRGPGRALIRPYQCAADLGPLADIGTQRRELALVA